MRKVKILFETDYTDLKGKRLDLKLDETYPLDDELARRLVARKYAAYTDSGSATIEEPELKESTKAALGGDRHEQSNEGDPKVEGDETKEQSNEKEIES